MKKLALIACLSFLLVGCASGPDVGTSTNCIMNPGKAAKITTTFNGTEVGFCCEKCEKKWGALSDAEKQAALDKAK